VIRVRSPVSHRLTVLGLLLLTLATGIVDSISILVFGHVFVANMTGNVIFLGFWAVPHSGVDMTAGLMSFAAFVLGAVLGGRFARHFDYRVRRWITAALGLEILILLTLAVLAGAGVLDYHGKTKLVLVVGLAITFGMQNATARQFGIQDVSTTVLTSAIVGIGVDSKFAGGSGEYTRMRVAAVLTMCAGAAIGAALSRVTVAPVIALAAAVVGAAAATFRFGPPVHHGD
jgi:uncharacterized membrane protein YoaK (UPF0700 family)